MTSDTEPKMKKGAIALLDVLGWKGVWQRNERAIEDLLSMSDDAQVRVRRIVQDGEYAEVEGRFEGLVPEVLTISDTLAFTVYGEHGPAIELCTLLAIGTIHRSLELRLPVRGAISYGNFLARDNVLVGPAVDEVASWYEHTEWVGVHLTPSAALPVQLSTFFNPKVLVQWNVPSKSGLLRNSLVCNWPAFIPQGENSIANRESLVDCLTSLGPITTDVGGKLINTIEFYDAVRNSIAR